MTEEKEFFIIDKEMTCVNCGGEVSQSYVHWGEVKVHCKKCDLYFIYNSGDRFNTIEIVDKDHYESQEVIKMSENKGQVYSRKQDESDTDFLNRSLIGFLNERLITTTDMTKQERLDWIIDEMTHHRYMTKEDVLKVWKEQQ